VTTSVSSTLVPQTTAPPTSVLPATVPAWRAAVAPLWDAYFSPSGGAAEARALASLPPPPSTGLAAEWATTWGAVTQARQATALAPPGSGAPAVSAAALLNTADARLRRLEADLLGAGVLPGEAPGTALDGTVVGSVRLRGGASTATPVLGTVPRGATVVIACITEGERVSGPRGPDSYWDYIHYEGMTGYVANTYVASGPFIDGAPACAATGGP